MQSTHAPTSDGVHGNTFSLAAWVKISDKGVDYAWRAVLGHFMFICYILSSQILQLQYCFAVRIQKYFVVSFFGFPPA